MATSPNTTQAVLPGLDATLTVSPAPRKRGRPRKNPLPEDVAPTPPKKRGRPRKNPMLEEVVPAVPKKRGRPRKNPLPEDAAAATDKTRVAKSETPVTPNVPKTSPEREKTSVSVPAQPNFQKASTRTYRRPEVQFSKKQVGNKAPSKYNQQKQQKRVVAPSVTRDELSAMTLVDLRKRAKDVGVDVFGLHKDELVERVYQAMLAAEGFVSVAGILDVLSEGYGFIRTSGYLPGKDDVYVPAQMIKQNRLRKGDYITGLTKPKRETDKFAALYTVYEVNDKLVGEVAKRVNFKDLTPVYPDEKFMLEHGRDSITGRIIDLVSPIGRGQRGLIVSPPKAGKTTILKDIAASISANYPDVHLMCLLVDERPEEVTDMQRSVKGEVISSTFDMPTENHIAVAELVIERAKRLVEEGKDVVILLDSITRLARAYNLAQPVSGRILSGGVDSAALYPPKRFLGAARNIEGGGSLTILASALVDTGSKMDEVIFEEFKGTGNMELKLDRNLADRRIFPAIDPIASGTRKEELLLEPQEAPIIWGLRGMMADTNSTERAMTTLIKTLKQTNDNGEFLAHTAKRAMVAARDAER